MTVTVEKPKKAFIVLTHRYLPKKGARGEMEVHEDVEFVDKIRNRHITSATAIIDVVNERMESRRDREKPYEDYVAHVIKTYPKHYKKLLELLEKEVPESLRDKTEADYDAVKTVTTPDEVKELIGQGWKIISTKKADTVEGEVESFIYTLGKMDALSVPSPEGKNE